MLLMVVSVVIIDCRGGLRNVMRFASLQAQNQGKLVKFSLLPGLEEEEEDTGPRRVALERGGSVKERKPFWTSLLKRVCEGLPTL